MDKPMEKSVTSQIIFLTVQNNPTNDDCVTLLADFQQPNVLQSQTFVKDTSSVPNSTSFEKLAKRRSIYVCTFCQVFSTSDEAVAEHIASVHNVSLPVGTRPENFVSRLQALPNENEKCCRKKVGRPRKLPKEHAVEAVDTVCNFEPLPGPDGLYWCQKCHKHFRKPRQLSRHVCLEIDDQDNFSDDSSVISDGSEDFQVHMSIDPVPWTRRQKRRNDINSKENNNETSLEFSCNGAVSGEDGLNKVTSKWRNDPSYVPPFRNENEKLAFEKHLKSIDYSFVDDMFIIERKRCKIQSGNVHTGHHFSKIYTCIKCKKVLKSLFHIRMHCLTHTDVQPFTCPECPYRTNSKGSLYTHMRKHTGNVFHCSYCGFQSTKRAHMLDHEATHSTTVQLCKLCKNSYKTVKSLIAHIRRYHNNPGGKRYIKSLSSKQSKESLINCNICQKKFKSAYTFENHNMSHHNVCLPPPPLANTQNDILKNASEGGVSELHLDKLCSAEATSALEQSVQVSAACVLEQSSPIPATSVLQQPAQISTDTLADIVLDNFLKEAQCETDVLCENAFETSEQLSDAATLLNGFQRKSMAEKLPISDESYEFCSSEASILAECEKTLNLNILNECLHKSNFSDNCLTEVCNQKSNLVSTSALSMDCSEQYILSPDFPDSVLQSAEVEQLHERVSEDVSDKTCTTESKSAEIKLFEKCRRAPAYVCCVCSAIYICPATLKVHLKEHVNTSALLEQQEDFEPEKISQNEFDNVCKILQDPIDSCSSDEKELEKLYTSSLDMMWYLPAV
ncbi:Zinc finger protein ZFAT, partial [Stegodyphus mimosarum]